MSKRNRILVVIVTSACLLSCRNAEVPGELNFPQMPTGGSTGGGSGINVNPASGLTTTEAGGSATFAVNLFSPPTSNVTVTIATNDATEGWVARTGGVCDTSATAASSSCTLTFTPATWANAQNVKVIGQDDNLDDGDIAYTLTLTASSADSNYSGAVTATANLTNTDDDTAGFSVTPTTGLITRQDGLVTNTIQIKLTAQPSANVTFTLISNDTNKGQITTPAGGSFTFTNANWNTSQNLIITGQGATTGAYKVILSGSVTSSDPAYAALGNFLGAGLNLTNFSTATKRFFVTASSYDGLIGGVAGADSKCNSDANKPNGGNTYKAMLVDGTPTRRACTVADCTSNSGNLDWALSANTPYIRPDGTTIATTNGGGIFVTLGATPLTNSISVSSGSVATGLGADWLTGSGSSSNCQNWSVNDGHSLLYGSMNATNTNAIDTGSQFCSLTMYHLYCAEQ